VKFILPDVDEFAQQFLAIPCNIRDRRLRPDDLSETIDKARKIAVSMKFDPLVSASCRRFRRWRHLRRCRFDRRPKCDGNSRAGEETGNEKPDFGRRCDCGTDGYRRGCSQRMAAIVCDLFLHDGQIAHGRHVQIARRASLSQWICF
jgi:hypothetical protein